MGGSGGCGQQGCLGRSRCDPLSGKRSLPPTPPIKKFKKIKTIKKIKKSKVHPGPMCVQTGASDRMPRGGSQEGPGRSLGHMRDWDWEAKGYR